MTTLRRCLDSLSIILLLCSPARNAAVTPDGKGDSLKTYVLDPVYVTGAKFKSTRNDIPLGISTVGQSAFEITASPTVPFVLTNEVPSLFVTQRSNGGFGIGQGSAGTISMRGVSGSPNTDVLVLIDGRPDFMGIMGHPLPDAYSVENVERVEVIRGPASYLYGTNAMAGAINIITKRPRGDGFLTGLSLSGGSFNTRQARLSSGWSDDQTEYLVTGSYFATDGHRAYANYRSKSGSAHVGHRIDDRFQVSANGTITDFHSTDPGLVSSPLIDNWADATRGGFNLDLDNTLGSFSGTMKFHGNFGSHAIFDGFHSTDHVAGIMFYETARLFEGNMTTAGFDFKSYGGDAENRLTGFSFGSHDVTEYAPYVHLQQILGNTVVSAAVRLEHNSLFGNEFVPYGGFTYRIPETSTMLRAVVSKGFRSPTIRELYLFPAPTPDLQPERLWNYEAGIVQHLSQSTSGEVTVYQNEGSNIIRTEGIYPNLLLRNSGSFRHRGIELQMMSRLGDELAVSANYSYLDPGNETYASPGNKIGSTFRFTGNGLSANLSATYIGDLYGSDNSRQKLDNFVLLNSNVSYNVVRNLVLLFTVENILNASYQILYDYPMPGRGFTAGIRAEL